MQILEEQSTPFSTQIQDVTKGINRIRYLKQKINTTYCLLKGINAINDDDDDNTQGQTQLIKYDKNNDSSKEEAFLFQRTNRRGLKTVRSERSYNLTNKRLNPKQNISKLKQNYQNEFVWINKNKWNDNFFTLKQSKSTSTRPQTRQIKRDNNIDTFYPNLLSKNMPTLLSSQNQPHKLSITQLKKANYNLIKKEKQQRKIKLQQQKENRLNEMMKKKQKIKSQQKSAQKKIFLFKKEKDQDLKSIKQQQKSKKFDKINQDIKQQLRLQEIQNEKLKRIQESLLMKQKLKRIIQTKMKNQQKNHQSEDKNTNKKQRTQIISQLQIFDDM